MWDTAPSTTQQLSHDLPCLRCGHAAHTYLACDDGCACQPVAAPRRSSATATVELLRAG